LFADELRIYFPAKDDLIFLINQPPAVAVRFHLMRRRPWTRL